MQYFTTFEFRLLVEQTWALNSSPLYPTILDCDVKSGLFHSHLFLILWGGGLGGRELQVTSSRPYLSFPVSRFSLSCVHYVSSPRSAIEL